ncbi:MAG TPA: hypothetical protein VKZ83_01850 [Phototrophicaceae bacterium]|nr:hypothetical protein [Phototrophicaceae bacterium]
MAADLHEMLESALHAGTRELSGARPAEGAVADWVQTVRRRRTARHVLRAAVAVPVAAGIGAAVWFALGAGPSEAPVATPPPAPTMTEAPPPPEPSPETSASPEVEDEPAAADEGTRTEVEVPGLPPYLETDEDVLALAAPGWALAAYQVADPDRDGFAVPRTIFLVGPGGERFRVVDVPEVELLEIHYWRAGEPRARVTFGSYVDRFEGTSSTGWLDLSSGELVADDGVQGSFVGLGPGGAEVWFDAGSASVVLVEDGRRREVPLEGADEGATLSPGGTHVAAVRPGASPVIVVADLDSGETTTTALPQDRCVLAGWLDEVSLLVQCMTDNEDGSPRFTERTEQRVTVLGTGQGVELAGTALADHEVWPSGQWLEDGAVLVKLRERAALESDPGLEACGPTVGVWRDGALVEVPPFGPDARGSVGAVAAHGGLAFLGGELRCTFGEDPPTGELLRLEPRTGELVTLLPVIEQGGDEDEAGRRAGLVSSWVLAR